ncbi:lachesin [Procambarus clarkii]|uniref:lachesin n=1 Tax=Procambarus clarkii TaxID=6728 RepID=UPI001E678B4C|nr:lachesin-like [Procambarus clarkii]
MCPKGPRPGMCSRRPRPGMCSRNDRGLLRPVRCLMEPRPMACLMDPRPEMCSTDPKLEMCPKDSRTPRSGMCLRGTGGPRPGPQRGAAWVGVALAALVSSTLLQVAAATKEKPYFLEPISNVTVPAGRDVRLACVVDHLGSYKLAWIQRDRSAILTVGNHVITRNNRIGVSHDGHRTWYLNIKDVRPGDAGTYMCQINTAIAISQTGHVSVVVPPYIKDDMSSRDVFLLEGMNLTLACSARGSPVPTIKWRREDANDIRVNLTTLMEVPGPLLQLTQVGRTDMGAYLCIASNGIPPSVSKRIQVEVKFLPTVYVPHQLVGVPLGQDVTIECYIEAWPAGLNYWKRPNGIEVLHSDDKYEVKEVVGSQKYKTHMLLTITEVTRADNGEYNCIANNSQGGAEQVVRVSASPPFQNNRNALEKGFEMKEHTYGKPSLSAVNWSKDNDASGALQDDHDDHRKYPARTPISQQRQTTKRLQNPSLEDDSSSPPSSSSSSSASSSAVIFQRDCNTAASLTSLLAVTLLGCWRLEALRCRWHS